MRWTGMKLVFLQRGSCLPTHITCGLNTGFPNAGLPLTDGTARPRDPKVFYLLCPDIHHPVSEVRALQGKCRHVETEPEQLFNTVVKPFVSHML